MPDKKLNPEQQLIQKILDESNKYWETHQTPTELSLSFTPETGPEIHFKGNYHQAALAVSWFFAGLCRQIKLDPELHNTIIAVLTQAIYNAGLDKYYFTASGKEKKH